MPDFAPYEMDNEAAGTVRYRTVSGERRPTAKATAAKQVLAYQSVTPPVPVPTALDNSYISDFTEAAQDAVGAMVANSSKVSLAYVDATPSLTADIVAGSLGPADIANRLRRLWLPAGRVAADGEWIALAGAPAFAQRNSLYGAIDLDSASSEAVMSLRPLMVPDDYASGLSIYLVHTNLGAGSGNVVWRVGYSVATDAGTFPSLTTADLTIAAPSQNVNKYSLFSALTPTVAAGHMIHLSCGRIGGDAADTLGNDAGFLGHLVAYTADS